MWRCAKLTSPGLDTQPDCIGLSGGRLNPYWLLCDACDPVAWFSTVHVSGIDKFVARFKFHGIDVALEGAGDNICWVHFFYIKTGGNDYPMNIFYCS